MKFRRYMRYENGGKIQENIEPVLEEEEEEEVKVEEKTLFDKIIDFITGSDVPRSFSQYLRRYGDNKIDSIEIGRAPIQKAVNILMNLISNGLYSKISNKIGVDSFFHLYLIIKLDNGKKLRLEKNQNLKISSYSSGKNEEILPVSLRDETLTLNEMFEKTYSKYGRNRVNIYNALSTNCSRFVLDFLQSNKLLTLRLKKFISQNVKQLSDELPDNVKKAAKNITDTASYLNKILEYVTNGYLRLKSGGVVKKK